MRLGVPLSLWLAFACTGSRAQSLVHRVSPRNVILRGWHIGRTLGCFVCATSAYHRHLLAASDNLGGITLLERCKTIDSLVVFGVLVHDLLVDMLLQVFHFGDMWVVLVVDVAGHEVDSLEPSLDLT